MRTANKGALILIAGYVVVAVVAALLGYAGAPKPDRRAPVIVRAIDGVTHTQMTCIIPDDVEVRCISMEMAR